MNILVTGGAGFIGSHLIDRLMKLNHSVVCIDNLSLGSPKNIQQLFQYANFRFYLIDLLEKEQLLNLFKNYSFDIVFHLAANSDIQQGIRDWSIDLSNTFLTTFNILECMSKTNVKKIVFASSSAIYGESVSLLNEDRGPLFPVSCYGAAKLASEGYISAFCEAQNGQAWILRFPNVVGERSTHGVIFDFIRKLEHNSSRLEVLGDGLQQKPYLYVKDLIDAMIFVWEMSSEKINYFNVGVRSATTVRSIAQMVIEEMSLENVKISYSDSKKGWVGDVSKFAYDLSKIHALGWAASTPSDEAVRKAIKAELFNRRYINNESSNFSGRKGNPNGEFMSEYSQIYVKDRT